jgi:CheY-like chemotaxis protein
MADQRKVILHADDEHGWRQYVTARFAPQYRVEFAADFEGALARLAKGGVDLLILDHLMPGTEPLDDAAAVCAHLRKRHPGLPIIIFTGALVDSPTTREELERMIGTPVVCKEDVESDRDQLQARVAEYLGEE